MLFLAHDILGNKMYVNLGFATLNWGMTHWWAAPTNLMLIALHAAGYWLFSPGALHIFLLKKKPKKNQMKWSFNNKRLIIYTIWNNLLQHLKENIQALPQHAPCLTCPSLVPTFPFLSGLVLQQEMYFLNFSSSLCHNITEENWQWGSQSNLWTLISFLFLSCSTYLLETSQTMW